ncbi:tRNA dihydrouridine synthase [Aureococcus anophagefferens]|nr:tRNA dihydrouridine synthase [Aureococcus anophagefferens]
MDAKRFVADAAYRRAVFEAGAGAPADRPLVAQFAGDDPATILAAARFIEDRVDVVELNCGCPRRSRRAISAFLLGEPEVIVAVVRALKRGSRAPSASSSACSRPRRPPSRWRGASRPRARTC